MSILEWFPLLNETELLSSLSQSLLSPKNQSSALFVAYLILSVLIKRAAFLAAFFMSCMLFEMKVFDSLSEASLYLITFCIYSYVIFDIACNNVARIACVILLLLPITLAYDAYFYGINGYYGATKTFVYNNIEHLAMYAHIIFISTLIPYRRIRDGFRRFIDSVLLVTRNSAYFLPV